MKYLLDRWGLPRFLDEVEAVLGTKLRRMEDARCTQGAAPLRNGHIGIHAQK